MIQPSHLNMSVEFSLRQPFMGQVVLSSSYMYMYIVLSVLVFLSISWSDQSCNTFGMMTRICFVILSYS